MIQELNKGDRVKVIGGAHVGRIGTLLKKCSVVFADYVRIEFDLKKRERIQKTGMVLKSDIETYES
jgi:preprotein translocase subunit YajC